MKEISEIIMGFGAVILGGGIFLRILYSILTRIG